MKLLALTLGLTLTLLSLTTAAPAPADGITIVEPEPTTEEPTLEKRKKAQSCKIINADEYVNCRYTPHLDSGAIFGLKLGEKYVFACKKKGDCYGGNCTWDQITLYGTTCYVNGYFTDSNCSSAKLPAC
ncbi:hypothetical protein BDV12DRAFT_6591 [Aspergillus spectabilis]